MREVSERLNKPDVFLTADTLELLAQHWWPGNVRQLRNEIQRLVALSRPGQGIGPEHLSPEITSAAIGQHVDAPAPSVSPRLPVTSLAAAVDGLERELIEATLHHSSGNISEAARSLGLTRRGLYLKLRRLGFETTPFGDKVSVARGSNDTEPGSPPRRTVFERNRGYWKGSGKVNGHPPAVHPDDQRTSNTANVPFLNPESQV